MRRFFARLANLCRSQNAERELAREIDAHLALMQDDFERRGLPPHEAKLAARRSYGGIEQAKELHREARSCVWIEQCLKDLHYAVRILLRAPGFTAVAVITLALGIGANTAIFSVIDAVLLRPPGFPDPGRLLQLMLFSPGWAPGKNATGLSIPEFNVLREQRKVFDEMAAYDSLRGINLTDADPPEQVRGIRVSAGYFALFGAKAALGRTFTAQEDQPGGAGVAVVTEGFRNRRFHGADPTGKALTLGGGAYTILGVLDASFSAEGAPDVFLPLEADPSSTNPAHIFRVAARLHPGVTLAQAKAELQLAHQEFKRKFPTWTTTRVLSETFTAEPLWETTVGESRRPLLVLSAAVGLVLLIACANVANLLMARATVCQREIALRAALGASRTRIVCQLLAESTLLSIGGGMVGLLVGRFGLSLFLAMRPDAIPRLSSAVTLNPTVLAFTFALAIATGVLFGILPAFSAAAQLDGAPTLIAGGVRRGSHPRHIKARSLLVVTEIALALILLTGAGLLIRTFWALRTVDPGFDAQNVLTMEMSLAGTRFETPAAMAALVRDAEKRIENLPGVAAAAATFSLPLEGQLGGPVAIEGHPNDRYGADAAYVSSRYFDVFRIPLREGRLFNERDDENSPAVAAVNEAMAQGHNGEMRWSSVFPWRDSGPLGERVTVGKAMGPPFEDHVRQIVGVAGEVRDIGLNRRPPPMLYVPIPQLTQDFARMIRGVPLHWVIRTRTEPYSLRNAIEGELRVASGGLPVAHTRTMVEVVSESTARDRFNMTLLCVFAAIALLLGAIGVYGLMAYTVQHRMHEIGVRMALGARPGDVRSMVVLEGMRLAATGVLLGIPAALAVTPMMGSLLFGVQPRDPAVIVWTAVVLIVAALVATYVPAYRATHVDPATALRCE